MKILKISVLLSLTICFFTLKSCKKNNYICTYRRILKKIKSNSINKKDENGKTELDYACHFGRVFLIKQLLKYTELSIYNNKKLMLEVYTNSKISKKNKRKIIKLLLAFGADIDFQDTSQGNKTLLMYAAINLDKKLVKYLISLFADVNLQDDNGNTALIHALQWSSSKKNNVIKELLYKSDINIKNIYGQNALILSLIVRNPTVALEIVHNLDINLKHKDNAGNTALSLARKRKYINIEKLIYQTIDSI